jgi:hypothetical protein
MEVTDETDMDDSFGGVIHDRVFFFGPYTRT